MIYPLIIRVESGLHYPSEIFHLLEMLHHNLALHGGLDSKVNLEQLCVSFLLLWYRVFFKVLLFAWTSPMLSGASEKAHSSTQKHEPIYIHTCIYTSNTLEVIISCKVPSVRTQRAARLLLDKRKKVIRDCIQNQWQKVHACDLLPHSPFLP